MFKIIFSSTIKEEHIFTLFRNKYLHSFTKNIKKPRTQEVAKKLKTKRSISKYPYNRI